MAQMNRLDVLLKAQVVCATLSGSGSQSIVEAVMLSAELAAAAGGGGNGAANRKRERAWKKIKTSLGSGDTVLKFDAVVMDEAAQSVEPSSLIPFKFKPRHVHSLPAVRSVLGWTRRVQSWRLMPADSIVVQSLGVKGIVVPHPYPELTFLQ